MTQDITVIEKETRQVEQHFFSMAAQEGIAFAVMAFIILALIGYVKLMDSRAAKRAAEDDKRMNEAQKRDDTRIKEQNAREDERIKRMEEQFQKLFDQMMGQQKEMMGILFKTVNNNTSVNSKIVEKLGDGTGSTVNETT